MYKFQHTHILISKYKVNNMKIWKILIGISILFLLIGSAAAIESSDFKPLDDYTAFDSVGYSNYTTDHTRYILVEGITFDDDLKEEWFTSHPEYDYKVESVGDNIYSVEDGLFQYYGYQEVVELDDGYYMVSINHNSKLSPSEVKEYLADLKEFNELNNLKPIEI